MKILSIWNSYNLGNWFEQPISFYGIYSQQVCGHEFNQQFNN